MRIAILGGGGAMGGLFGGYLARAGNDVTLIDVSRPAVDTINDAGLTIEEKDGSHPVIEVPASTDPAEVGPVDLIINFVKCYHTEAAVRAAAPMIEWRNGSAEPAERLGQCAAHRLDCRRGQGSGRPYLSFGYAARARQRQTSGLGHDLCRRARRQADASASKSWRRPSAAPGFEVTVSPAFSMRFGRSWRSTPARCRLPA